MVLWFVIGYELLQGGWEGQRVVAEMGGAVPLRLPDRFIEPATAAGTVRP